MRKWANLIFNATAVMGWVLLGVLALDATFNQSKLIIRIMAGQ